MPATLPTIKSVIFSSEDKYRKKKMVAILEKRNMISQEAKTYILKGIR